MSVQVEQTPAFRRAANMVLAHEGVLSLDEDDPGNWTGGEKGKGELVGTKYGISAAAYPTVDIRNLNKHQAENIYFRDYWLKFGCDKLPPRVGMVYFDGCVNQGVAITSRALQRALDVKVDGIVGDVTLGAARRIDPAILVPAFCAERAWSYTGTKNFQKYGRGWLRRVLAVCAEATRP